MPVTTEFTIRVGGAAPNPWDFQPQNHEESDAHSIRSQYKHAERHAESIAQARFPIQYDSTSGKFQGEVEEHFVEKARQMVSLGAFSGENFYQTEFGRIEWVYAGGIDNQSLEPIYHCDYLYKLTINRMTSNNK